MDISVISNEKRLQLLVCLSKEHSVTELLKECDLSQSALSQHLSKLKNAGLVECTRSKNSQIYKTVNKKIVSIAQSILSLK